MSAPKVIEVLKGYRGGIVVTTESDGSSHSWTATDEEICGGGVISSGGTETLNHCTYNQQGNQWHSYSPETGSQKVSKEIAGHLDLVKRTAAIHKGRGQVQ